MPTLYFRVFWAFWAATGLAFEVWAVWLDKESGDTLSEQVWALVPDPRSLLWWLVAGTMIWATFHFLFHRWLGWM